jgi:hypothetical protein
MHLRCERPERTVVTQQDADKSPTLWGTAQTPFNTRKPYVVAIERSPTHPTPSYWALNPSFSL